MFKKVKLQKHKLFDILINDYHIRTIIFTCFSLGFGIIYAIFNGFIAILSSSMWFGAITCYYLFLNFLRAGILLKRYKRNKNTDFDDKKEYNNFSEIKQYRNCGILFLFLIICLGAIVLQIVRSEKSFAYAMVTVYITAIYTFYRVAMAIYNIFKAGKHKDYTTRTLRCINLITALGSILTLQAIMLFTYSTSPNVSLMNTITGTIVCILVALVGIYMIRNGNEKLKVLSKN
jgi:hypothetical protein